jgi:hypothetical protein
MKPGLTRELLDAQDAQAWMECARCGDFETAWALSDRIRLRNDGATDHHAPRHVQRIWNGAPLEDRRVLIRCYHGLGDTIQFIRYLPLVRASAREVVVWVQRDLLPILEATYGGIRFLPLHDGTPDVAYDVDIEVMELPYAFRTTLSTIPCDVPYFRAAAMRLPAHDRPRVGLAWRAGDWDTRRSVPFELIRRLLDVSSVDWYSVQYNARPAETHGSLHSFPNASVSLTAQYMRALDLVITIDSMPAHLAGALGAPVWTLLTHHADWRWLLERKDSPWYPTMQLFRQPAPGQWAPVIDMVRHALLASPRRLPSASDTE